MINKKNLWFLTLFSLILVLSVYYITMPSDLLLSNASNYLKTDQSKDNDKEKDQATVKVEESEYLTALRVNSDEEVMKEIDGLKDVMTNKDSSVEEKNQAFEKMKKLNIVKAEEQTIEKKLEETYQLKTFVKINNDQIKVVVDKKEHDVTLANNIMRTVQEQYQTKMYITVQFKG